MDYPWAILLAGLIDRALSLLVFVLAAWAFVDCLTKASVQFQRAFKRTKGFWLALTGGAAVFSLFGVLSPGLFLFALIAATVAGVYLTDVRPAVGLESKGPGSW